MIVARLNAAQLAPFVRPSFAAADQLGTGTGADTSVVADAASNGDPAPRDGIVIVGLPAGADCRIRIGLNAVATINDHRLAGAGVHHFPIRQGERVSLFGQTAVATFTATLSMAE